MYGGYFMGPTWSGQPATDGNGLSSEAQYLNQLWAQSSGVNVAAVATLPAIGLYPDAAQMRAQLAALEAGRRGRRRQPSLGARPLPDRAARPADCHRGRGARLATQLTGVSE